MNGEPISPGSRYFLVCPHFKTQRDTYAAVWELYDGPKDRGSLVKAQGWSIPYPEFLTAEDALKAARAAALEWLDANQPNSG